jgi:hypothetical protein
MAANNAYLPVNGKFNPKLPFSQCFKALCDFLKKFWGKTTNEDFKTGSLLK